MMPPYALLQPRSDTGARTSNDLRNESAEVGRIHTTPRVTVERSPGKASSIRSRRRPLTLTSAHPRLLADGNNCLTGRGQAHGIPSGRSVRGEYMYLWRPLWFLTLGNAVKDAESRALKHGSIKTKLKLGNIGGTNTQFAGRTDHYSGPGVDVLHEDLEGGGRSPQREGLGTPAEPHGFVDVGGRRRPVEHVHRVAR